MYFSVPVTRLRIRKSIPVPLGGHPLVEQLLSRATARQNDKENGMKSRLRLPLLLTFLMIASVLIPTAIWAQPPVTGAIFTTDSTCNRVDQNLYSSLTAVYLNGGPQHPQSAGLPDGNYYVQVTDPGGGSLLGTSVGSTTPTPVSVSGGVFAGQCQELWNLVFKASDGTQGFDVTPNPGGEYKVWISTVPTFDNNSTKTDNFKVFIEPPQSGVVIGFKFYDANVDGVWESGEAPIAGWVLTLWSQSDPTMLPQTDTTDANGTFSFFVPNGTYGLCEVIPQAAPTWVPTTHTFATGIAVPPTPEKVQFGNVCLGSGGGLTLGFWSNKNGQNLITAADLCLLDSLNLVSANGTGFDPVAGCPSPSTTAVSSGKTNLRSWLLNATATNMAYMLSAQLTAMELNVQHGFVLGSQIVYAPGTGLSSPGGVAGFASISDLMTAANNSLGTSPNTTTAGPARTLQEALKNALDKANNNLNFVQAEACDINYSVSEASCIPAQ